MDPLTTVSIFISMGISAILLKYICYIGGQEQPETNSISIQEDVEVEVELPPKYETPPNYNELYNDD